MARILLHCVSALFAAATAISPVAANVAFAQESHATTQSPVGLHLFLSTGCGACHRIAGTEARGKIGPDLTHLASRSAIGANLMPMTRENLADWIRHTQKLKPGARMPSFGMLPVSETNAIVDYLATLK